MISKKFASVMLMTGALLLTGAGRLHSNMFFELGPVGEKVTLQFSMTVHEDVFEQTNFGEPPQIAIWLEHPETKQIRTVWVARRSGRRLWKGKFECPTALPIWESRHKNEQSEYKARGLLKRLIDAVSGATPKGGIFETTVDVEAGTTWNCYVELNVSADFNVDFPYRDENDAPDPEVNGQPSLVYFAKVTAAPGKSIDLQLIGRSDQWIAVEKIISDVSGITTAKDVVTDLRVTCVSSL